MYCIRCGNKLESENKYCTFCGNKIDNNDSNNSNILKSLSIVLGCFSIVCSLLGIVGLLLGIIGLVLGVVSRRSLNNKIGVIFGGIGISISILFCVLYMVIIVDFIKGDDYEYYARDDILSIF